MSIYTATVSWVRGDQPFYDGKYSRAHTVSFDGGVSIAGSSAPESVPPPLSKVDAADPEELLVASMSMCHMLFFLDFARRGKFVVDSYTDAPRGELKKDERGRIAVTKVTLQPVITWSQGPSGALPSAAELERLHGAAHEACYIANSFRGEVVVDAPLA